MFRPMLAKFGLGTCLGETRCGRDFHHVAMRRTSSAGMGK
jgi:hypothetical protein